jgi:hypothetical protein
MNDPQDKKGKPPESKPGTTPPGGPHPEVAPSVSRPPGGPIREVAPDVEKGRPIKEVAPDVSHRGGGPIKEMAPDVGRGVHPEVAPDVYESSHRPGATHTLLYAPTIQSAIAEGNLQRMQQLASQAEQQLAQYGDLRSAVEILKIEIAKLQHKHK